jgi:hypothetical protein
MRRRRKVPTTAAVTITRLKRERRVTGKKTTVHVRWQDKLPSAISGIDVWDIGVAGQIC